ncbi:CbtA family protein [Acrocarpospora macrocephala]|uniref:Membrane protein n=1 Tax=Acrocarpospora macrocephala TaxID=150177 RepID=A0A5M3XA35_9ACTN|nr:CbtA family protein [Acrocarpospora macrocephala]GES14938.1 membrane protein [Acrocarpospora macrocephala]
MIRPLFVRGLLAGIIAGLAAGVFAYFAGEPHIDSAIALEEAAAHTHAEVPLVSRSGQVGGLFLATALYGLAVGGLFGLAFALVRGRIGPRSGSVLSITLAAAGFVAVVLVPFVKYPANPPAVGDPATIGSRTSLYLVAVAIGLLAMAAAAVAHRIFEVNGEPVRWLATGLGFLVPVTAAWVFLPVVSEVPEGFPADLLWDFRVSSLGTQVVLWGVLGVSYAYLWHRSERVAGAPQGVPA